MMASPEDIEIAKVVLAGWRIELAAWSIPTEPHYRLLDPAGRLLSVHPTRYTAALRASDNMEAGIGLPA